MNEKETALDQISELVKRFSDQYDVYSKGDYNETKTKKDFIDPFFKALGWDIDNTQGLAEAYRDVVHDDKIKVGDNTKSSDYCFTLSGQKSLVLFTREKQF